MYRAPSRAPPGLRHCVLALYVLIHNIYFIIFTKNWQFAIHIHTQHLRLVMI